MPGNINSISLPPFYVIHTSTLFFCFFSIYLFLFFGHMWDLSSLTRDQTHGPYSGSMESKQLDHQGGPTSTLY